MRLVMEVFILCVMIIISWAYHDERLMVGLPSSANTNGTSRKFTVTGALSLMAVLQMLLLCVQISHLLHVKHKVSIDF